MLQFSTNDFNYDKEDNIFTQESSALELPAREWNSMRRTPVENTVELFNPKTKKTRQFHFTQADMYDDEVMGWNYVSFDGINLLLIND